MVTISELPQENELVLGIIKKILPYGAFCALPEYNNTEAFMHISEVAPRWIKNIHEFISEGQTHVLKVHRIDLAKRQIDVSLKRVSEEEKKQKLASIREEKKLKKLLEVAISNSKSKLTEPQLRAELEKSGTDAFSVLESLAEGKEDLLEGLDLPKPLKTELLEIAKKSMKKALVEVKKLIKLSSYDSEGIDKIKKALKLFKDKVHVVYLGAPNYQVSLKAKAFKEGEKELDKMLGEIEKFSRQNNMEFTIEESV